MFIMFMLSLLGGWLQKDAFNDQDRYFCHSFCHSEAVIHFILKIVYI